MENEIISSHSVSLTERKSISITGVKKIDKVNEVVEENVRGVRVVKSFTREEDEIKKFDMEKLKETVFKRLCEANPVYFDCYDDNWLAKPEVFFLQPQTSLLYRDMMVFRGASMNQLKPVRVIMNERQKKFFFALVQEMEG